MPTGWYSTQTSFLTSMVTQQIIERLAALKCTQAERIAQALRFIVGLEALYRQLWQQWCEANPATAESLV